MAQFNKQVFLSAFVVVLLAVLVCFRFFGEIILHPDEFLFGASGDGLKNYFSVAYQVIHGDGLWFNGMLYPYGDHIIFADGQPLLTRVLQFFIEPNPANGPNIIAVMNLLMVSSFVLCAWCVHRLLVWNFVNPWFAVPFALCIAFLSPQINRFVGHYALAYTYFVPLVWLLIASYNRSNWPWLVAACTSTIILAFGFLHPYYLFIFVVFLGAVLGWELLLKRFRVVEVKAFFPQLFTLLLPLIVFMVYQKSIDPYTDRPTSPGGIYHFMATFQSVFTPVADPFRYLFHSYFFRIFIPTSWEGNAYIGMVASLTAFASVLAMFKRFRKRGLKVLSHPVLPPVLRSTFIPSIIILLFAMGLFHQLGLKWLAEFISPLKQFRSLGRVAWIFYYVFSIWTVYHLWVLYRKFNSINSGRFRYHIILVITLCGFVWMLDAIVSIKFTKEVMVDRTAKTAFSDHYINQWKSANVDVSEHQAILPMPLTLIGSEKIGFDHGHKSLAHAVKASFSSGLPILGGTMSRTSLRTTEITAQLVADSLFPRRMLDELDNDRNLLLLHAGELLNTEEERLIALGKQVMETEEYQLYSVSVSKIKNEYSRLAKVADSSLVTSINYQRPIPFEEAKEKLWGAPSFKLEPNALLFDSVLDSETMVNLRYWVKVDPHTEMLPNYALLVDGERKEKKGIHKNPNVLDGWLLVSIDFETKPGKRYTVSIQDRPAVVSRIALFERTRSIVHEDGERSFLNNVPLP